MLSDGHVFKGSREKSQYFYRNFYQTQISFVEKKESTNRTDFLVEKHDWVRVGSEIRKSVFILEDSSPEQFVRKSLVQHLKKKQKRIYLADISSKSHRYVSNPVWDYSLSTSLMVHFKKNSLYMEEGISTVIL